MEIKVISPKEWQLSNSTGGKMYIDGKFVCYTLEDEIRKIKIKHETAIPEGTYKVKLRKEGGFHQRYQKLYPKTHKGMLHIINVPNFDLILIHRGNYETDTSGCVLVGDKITKSGKDLILQKSAVAYGKIYPLIAAAIENNEEVTIKIIRE